MSHIIYNIAVEAEAWNPYGTTSWGKVPDALRSNVSPGPLVGTDKIKIISPLWENGKNFCILRSKLLQEVVADPVVDPVTPAESFPLVMPDGMEYTNRDPIIWVKKI
jgi:hypothetical protein